MTKKRNTGETITKKVLLAIADAGGSLALTAVFKHFNGHISAAQIRAISPSLVERFDCHDERTHRPIVRLSLTPLGVAYAATHRAGYKASETSFAEWQAAFERFITRRVPAALEILRDREDAVSWRQFEARRKEVDRANEKRAEERARKRSSVKRQTNWFKVNVLGDEPTEDSPEQETQLFPGEFTEEPTSPVAPATLNPPMYEVPSGKVHFKDSRKDDPNRIQAAKIAALPPTGPDPPPFKNATPVLTQSRMSYEEGWKAMNDPNGQSLCVSIVPDAGGEIERIKARARRLGYGAAIRPNGMLYNNELHTFEEWDRLIPY